MTVVREACCPQLQERSARVKIAAPFKISEHMHRRKCSKPGVQIDSVHLPWSPDLLRISKIAKDSQQVNNIP